MRFIRLLAAAAVTSVLAQPAFTAPHLSYPHTHRGHVVDDYHGQKVPDPYRWLEKDARTSPEVRQWIDAENKLTLAYLKKIPQRQGILKRLKRLWDFEKYSAPFKIAGRYYYFKNDGLQNQSVLYSMESLDGSPVAILNPNKWSKDGTVALVGLSFSEDGRYLAYARASAGSDWQEWHVHDLRNSKDLDDLLQWTKFTNASWTKDGKGFFYSRFDAPPKDQKYKALNKYQKVFYHRIGTPQTDDVLVFHRPDQPDWGFAPTVTEDGRYLVISIWKGTDPKNQLLYKDLLEPYGMPVALVDRFENEYTLLGNDGPVFYIKTDLHAPKGRVIAIDTRHPGPENWRELIPQADQALQDMELTGNLFIASYLQDAVTLVRIFRLDGAHLRDVDFPGMGSAGGFSGRRSDTETFFSYSSFNRPPTIYRYDLISGATTLWRQPKIAFQPDDFAVKQIFYESKDGTRIPMFMAYKKGLAMDGNRPTLLYGYGGFSISLTPGFSPARLAWMEMGGVFAMPNLRGGGEYGEEWHRSGTLDRKQNVFDDFIAAAEWLINHHYTRTARLAIQGASNGGLLVGATMTQRPDLFGAALPAVGVMDMLRFQKFTAGRYWVDDYGSSDNPEQFVWLRAYSPYHNIKPSTRYPATLITTADTDDRVIPGHSFKFASALQAAQNGDAPVLIRIETSAGHGGGKPTQKRIEEAADQWAFLFKNLKMDLPG
ncbi:MAG: prolyl oligopeptidase family protein, partial [Acidobacteriota bacterium]